MTRFEIEYADSDVRELIATSEADDTAANAFGEACFQAMMASDGYPCALVLVVDDEDKRRWELADGHNPDFNQPDVLY